MVKTLYNALQRAKIRADAFMDDDVSLGNFYNKVSEDSKRELKEIEERELRSLKKRIIDAHADRHVSIANVVDGSATFYSYGQAIIEQAQKVEDKYRDRSFGLAKRSDFLGIDPRNPSEVQEEVQYLSREEIIDPNKFFGSKLILPQIARKLIRKWNDSHDVSTGRRKLLVFLGTLAATSAAGAYIGYKGYGLLGGIAGGFGGYFLGGAGLILPMHLEDSTFDRISIQRESFERALNSLDTEVREHFPLDSRLSIVEPEVA